MGKKGVAVEKKKKKKGRPSLLDLQKRELKQQQEQQQQQQQQQLQKQQQLQQLRNNNNIKKQQNPSPNSSIRRSTRRNPNPNSDDDDDHSKRREKKLNQVLKLPNNGDDEAEVDEENSGSEKEGSSGSNLRKRKIDSIAPGSGFENHDKGLKKSDAANQASIQQESKLDDGPSTPLPDKKLLLFILERLQKKDTYGVFADPVDPEELPDYFEVIDHPMDFSTVRKKLTDGVYASLEQFEKDVFLICSNAMQYNAPDTIYFRQARSILELAKKDFDNLRQDSDDNEPEPEPKVVRRGRPPTKNLKRPPGRPPLERANSDFSEATLATTGGNTNRSNNDVRKGSPLLEKHGSVDLYARTLYGSRYGEAYLGWSAERYDRSDDMTGSALKGISMKHGKKHIVLDENRRNTYTQAYALGCRQEPSVLTTFDGERKNLIPVGLHTEYGYARSLSRFAAKLGPIAWKVASKKIERCLASGVKFGPGWVGESDAPAERPMQQHLPTAAGQPSPPTSSFRGDSSSAPTQGIVESSGDRSTEQKPLEEQLSEAATSSVQPKPDYRSSQTPCPSTAGNDTTPVSSSPIVSNDCGGSMLNNSTGAIRPKNPNQIHQSSNNQTHVNGLNGSYGLNFAAQMGKMIAGGRPTGFNHQSNPSTVTVSRTETRSSCPPPGDNNGCGEAKLLENSGTIKPSDYLPNAGPHQKKAGSAPPDLNVGFQSPGSPSSGRSDSVQPDLALQL